MDYTLLLKTGLSTVIVALCCYIWLKTRKLHRLTQHPGIKSFSDAFTFFAAAFLLNVLIVVSPRVYSQPLLVLFNYCLSMGGFLLVYSLAWRELDADWHYVLHASAIAVSLVDLFFYRYATFITQLFVLGLGVLMSYASFRAGKQQMRQLLFIALSAAFVGHSVNLLSALLPMLPYLWLASYLVTAGTFALVSFAVARSLGGKDG